MATHGFQAGEGFNGLPRGSVIGRDSSGRQLYQGEMGHNIFDDRRCVLINEWQWVDSRGHAEAVVCDVDDDGDGVFVEVTHGVCVVGWCRGG